MRERICLELLRRWGRIEEELNRTRNRILQKRAFVEVVLPVIILQLLLYLMSIAMNVNNGYDRIFLAQCMITAFLILTCVKVNANRKMIMIVVALISIGIFVQHLLAKEVSGYEDGSASFLFHIICGVISFAIIMRAGNNKSKLMSFFFSDKGLYVLTAISVVCYLACFVSGRINDASNWIIIGGVSIQGTEISKLIYFWILGVVSNRSKFEKHGGKVLIFFSVNAICLVVNSELGYLLVIMTVTLIMVVICTENREKLFRSMKIPGVIIGILIVIGCVIAICMLALGLEIGFIHDVPDKIKGRILGFLYPQQYLDTYGYQSEMVSIALYNGGFFGSGREIILPVAESDMIFAVTIAKLGLIFGLVIILFYTLFLIVGSKIACEKEDYFCMTFVVGVFVQALYNIAAVVGVVPIAGVPLYFISAGGSAMVCAMIMSAVIISVSGSKYQIDKKEVKNNEKTNDDESSDCRNMLDGISGGNIGCENGSDTRDITGN